MLYDTVCKDVNNTEKDFSFIDDTENLKCMVKICDESLSLIETFDELIVSLFSLWKNKYFLL